MPPSISSLRTAGRPTVTEAPDSLPAPERIESFYEEFAGHFLDDVIGGNERVREQIRFFARAIPESTKSVLIVGCGAGQAAHAVATRIAPHSRVLALDLSTEAVRIARAVFPHPRIEYRPGDAFEAVPETGWDVILLPDVFEHIPTSRRSTFAELLCRWLAPDGRVLLTLPTVGKQDSLRRSGMGLQVVDEDVSPADLLRLAEEMQGSVTYYAMMSVWETNDYAHVQIERGIGQLTPIGPSDRIELKGWPRVPLGRRMIQSLSRRLGITAAAEMLRRHRLTRRVKRAGRT